MFEEKERRRDEELAMETEEKEDTQERRKIQTSKVYMRPHEAAGPDQ